MGLETRQIQGFLNDINCLLHEVNNPKKHAGGFSPRHV